jgi:hypothetical protein
VLDASVPLAEPDDEDEDYGDEDEDMGDEGWVAVLMGGG